MFGSKWKKFGPPAGSSSGIQLPMSTRRDGSTGSRKKYTSVLSATGSFEIAGASRWLEASAGAAARAAANTTAARRESGFRNRFIFPPSHGARGLEHGRGVVCRPPRAGHGTEEGEGRIHGPPETQERTVDPTRSAAGCGFGVGGMQECTVDPRSGNLLATR